MSKVCRPSIFDSGFAQAQITNFDDGNLLSYWHRGRRLRAVGGSRRGGGVVAGDGGHVERAINTIQAAPDFKRFAAGQFLRGADGGMIAQMHHLDDGFVAVGKNANIIFLHGFFPFQMMNDSHSHFWTESSPNIVRFRRRRGAGFESATRRELRVSLSSDGDSSATDSNSDSLDFLQRGKDSWRCCGAALFE